MNWLLAWGALALVGVVVFFCLISKNAVDEKSIFADLQFAEVDGRGVAGGVLYTDRNGHHMAGIATRAGGRVWIYLGGVDARGGIYSVPGMEQVGVECRLVEGMISSRSVSPAVSSALRETCIK
ncbi:hypothetical protein [Stenotrophomonas lacuserhaii]|uniref:hypothetical protein n=1 Tax=Stenotrophomonas lacuserhaii TaxID=2760084 RepID=UPI0015FA85AA|nr:hypothetical protein [Stenotrophomonas lacuserhaii]